MEILNQGNFSMNVVNYETIFKERGKMAELWDVLDERGNKTGRLHERGKPMQQGEFHLVVHVWIIDKNNEFLIQKRTGGKWETTGGAAIAGEDSISAALREANEELGVDLTPKNGQLFKQYSRPHTNDAGNFLINVWIFRQEIELSAVVFQLDET